MFKVELVRSEEAVANKHVPTTSRFQLNFGYLQFHPTLGDLIFVANWMAEELRTPELRGGVAALRRRRLIDLRGLGYRNPSS